MPANPVDPVSSTGSSNAVDMCDAAQPPSASSAASPGGHAAARTATGSSKASDLADAAASQAASSAASPGGRGAAGTTTGSSTASDLSGAAASQAASSAASPGGRASGTGNSEAVASPDRPGSRTPDRGFPVSGSAGSVATSSAGGTPGTPPRRRRRLDPDALAELEEQRDLLLRSLDDLDREHEAGEIDSADHEALRDETTRRAAEVVRAIESGRIAIAERPGPSRGRLALAGLAVAGVAVAAGFAVASSSGTREAGTFASGEVRDLTDDRLEEASALARDSDIQGALDLYDAVLDDDPQNVEALSERGLLLASLSQAADLPELLTTGRASLERALEVDPGNPRPLFYLGLVQRLEGDEEAAVATLQEALAADPPPVLRQNIETFLGEGPEGGDAVVEEPVG